MNIDIRTSDSAKRAGSPEFKEPYDDPKGLTESEKAVLAAGISEQEEQATKVLAGDTGLASQLSQVLAKRAAKIQEAEDAEERERRSEPPGPFPGPVPSPAAFQGLDERSERVKEAVSKTERPPVPKSKTWMKKNAGKQAVQPKRPARQPPFSGPPSQPPPLLPSPPALSLDTQSPWANAPPRETESPAKSFGAGLGQDQPYQSRGWGSPELSPIDEAPPAPPAVEVERWPLAPAEEVVIRKALQAPASRHSPSSLASEISAATKESEILQLHALIRSLKEENLVHKEQNSEFASQLKNLNGQVNQMSVSIAQILERLEGRTPALKIEGMTKRESVSAAQIVAQFPSEASSSTAPPPAKAPSLSAKKFKGRK